MSKSQELRISLPCNWKTELLDELDANPDVSNAVTDLFGAKDRSFTGSGRPFFIMANRDESEIEDYINRVHDMGKRFTWLWNGKCLGYKKYNSEEQTKALKELDWLEDLGVEYITIVDPYLASFARQHHPKIKIKVSLISEVISLSQALEWQNIVGKEGIVNLSVMTNRNFPLLKQLRDRLDMDIQLLLNDACVNECPFRFFHYSETAHASQTHDVLKGFYNDWSVIACAKVKSHEPGQVLMAKWINPVDINKYLDVGINYFKISGRRYKTSWIMRVLKAYVQKNYDGNLGDLMNGYNFQTNPLDLAGSQFSEYTAAQAEVAPTYPEDDDLMIGIPENPAQLVSDELKTFMEKLPFKGSRCIENCGVVCEYCFNVADKAFYIPDEEKGKAFRDYAKYLWDYINAAEMFIPVEERKLVNPAKNKDGLYGMAWSPVAEEFCEGVLSLVPESMQRSARKAVRHISERTAEKENAKEVSKELVIAIFLQIVPTAFKHDLLDYLVEHDIDVHTYLNDDDIEAIKKLPYGQKPNEVQENKVKSEDMKMELLKGKEWDDYLSRFNEAYLGLPEVPGIVENIKPLVLQYRVTDDSTKDFWQVFDTNLEWGTGDSPKEGLPTMVHKTSAETIQKVLFGELDPMKATMDGLYAVEGDTSKLMECVPLLPLFAKAHAEANGN